MKRKKTAQPVDEQTAEPTAADLRDAARQARDAARQTLDDVQAHVRQIAEAAEAEAARLEAEAADREHEADALEAEQARQAEVARLRADLSRLLAEHGDASGELETAEAAVEQFTANLAAAEQAATDAGAAVAEAVTSGASPDELVRLTAERDATAGVPALVAEQVASAESGVARLNDRLDGLEESIETTWEALDDLLDDPDPWPDLLGDEPPLRLTRRRFEHHLLPVLRAWLAEHDERLAIRVGQLGTDALWDEMRGPWWRFVEGALRWVERDVDTAVELATPWLRSATMTPAESDALVEAARRREREAEQERRREMFSRPMPTAIGGHPVRARTGAR